MWAAPSTSVPVPTDTMVELSHRNFELVTQSNDTWVVLFQGGWCLNYGTQLENLKNHVARLQNPIKFGIVNAEEHTKLQGQHGITRQSAITYFNAKKQPQSIAGAENSLLLIKVGEWMKDCERLILEKIEEA